MLRVDFAEKPFSYLIEVNRRLMPFIMIPELFCSCHFCQVRDPATYHPEREHLRRNNRRESAAKPALGGPPKAAHAGGGGHFN